MRKGSASRPQSQSSENALPIQEFSDYLGFSPDSPAPRLCASCGRAVAARLRTLRAGLMGQAPGLVRRPTEAQKYHTDNDV